MQFLKADSIFNGHDFLAANAVLVLNTDGTLREVVDEAAVESGSIQKLSGTLTPGFVNSHCHLELSHLRGKIARHTGLPEFARQVILQRNNFSKEEIAEHLAAADLDMQQNGIVAVGDISNGADSFHQKTKSSIYYHTFIELIGLNPANSELIFDKGLQLLNNLKALGLHGSLAPHAPYSTSKALIKKIAEHNAQLRLAFSIHNQESNEENKFLMGQASGFDKLYEFLKLDLSWYKAPGLPSLQAYADALAGPSLLVHNTVSNEKDIKTVKDKQIYWCFCPAANLYIENKLPQFEQFYNTQQAMCLGTDSLASNAQLDVLHEASLILNNCPTFPVKKLLAALTLSGAQALGISDHFGQLIDGKNAGLNLIDVQPTQLRFIKKIV